VVWVGYDDPQPLGWGESGGVTALPAWMAFMKAAHDKRPVTDFPRPGSIITAAIDPTTGLLARSGEDGVEEEFLEGTAPSETAPRTLASRCRSTRRLGRRAAGVPCSGDGFTA